MLHAEKAKLERIIQIGKQLGDNNIEQLGHWGKYACVSCSGYIEFSLRNALNIYVEKKASPEVLNYVAHKLDGLQNPKSQKFVETLSLFKSDLGHEMETFFRSYPEAKLAIDSIMTNRHLIAHGRPCTISLIQVEKYYKSANSAIDFLYELLEA